MQKRDTLLMTNLGNGNQKRNLKQTLRDQMLVVQKGRTRLGSHGFAI